MLVLILLGFFFFYGVRKFDQEFATPLEEAMARRNKDVSHPPQPPERTEEDIAAFVALNSARARLYPLIKEWISQHNRGSETDIGWWEFLSGSATKIRFSFVFEDAALLGEFTFFSTPVLKGVDSFTYLRGEEAYTLQGIEKPDFQLEELINYHTVEKMNSSKKQAYIRNIGNKAIQDGTAKFNILTYLGIKKDEAHTLSAKSIEALIYVLAEDYDFVEKDEKNGYILIVRNSEIPE